MKSKRGAYFFIIDVLIGMFIFVITVFIISSFTAPKTSLGGVGQNLDILSRDFFNAQVYELDSYLTDDIPVKFMIYQNATLDEFIYFLALDDPNLAKNLTQDISAWLPANYGMSYWVGTNSSADDPFGDNVNTLDFVFYRNASTSPSMGFTTSKLTLLVPNASKTYEPAMTVITVWT